ncbi:MAG: helix-turn-helix domain-containing protein [Streptosporangiaceae bacterium]
MTVRHSPTVRRRRLAAELRRLREGKGFTIQQVAERIDCTGSKISRIETARVTVHPRDVRDLLNVYGVIGQRREALVTLARQARQKGWWRSYSDVVPSWFESFVGLESEASSMRTYETQFAPGLLQTEEYMRCVIRAMRTSAGPNEIERVVALRLARQELLTRDIPVQYWAVLDEAVLRRLVGGRGVMRLQLDRLVDAGGLPNVELQVLPFEAGAHAGMNGAFVLFGFPERDDPDVVFLENETSGLYMEEPKDVDRYTLVFDHLRAMALSPDESVALIRAVAKECGNR